MILVLAGFVAGVYLVYRLCAAVVSFVARIADAPERALFYVRLLLVGSARGRCQ